MSLQTTGGEGLCNERRRHYLWRQEVAAAMVGCGAGGVPVGYSVRHRHGASQREEEERGRDKTMRGGAGTARVEKKGGGGVVDFHWLG
mgnify:CR=1 FL=1